mgnify:CR=1 FL=1
MTLPKTADAARGKWKGILLKLGVDAKALTGHHCPCPMCGGTDRFRFDNKEGKGTYICNQCGSGDGLEFVKAYRGCDFKAACDVVDDLVGLVRKDPQRASGGAEIGPERRSEMLRDLWRQSALTKSGDIVHKYLSTRGVDDDQYADGLRTAMNCYYSSGLSLPAMIGVVVDVAGKPINLHRTFLAPDGSGKADVDAPRKMMPGSGELIDGACIRLGPIQECIGIAEGIETALAAMHMFNMPVWSAINSNILQKWIAPEGVKHVVIYGDNDVKFGGQAAAYGLAHKLAVKGITAEVCIPTEAGTDWADVAQKNSRCAQKTC